ncbi:MAG: DNA-processing protein DprA [Spirochaetota bacterium]
MDATTHPPQNLSDSSLKDNKFLEVLLHQMPWKLRQSLGEILLPEKQGRKINRELNRGKDKGIVDEDCLLFPLPPILSGSLPKHVSDHSDPSDSDLELRRNEKWRLQWLESCAAQVQSGLDNAWQLLKDLGLSNYISYRYFESSYRDARDSLERELRGDFSIILRRQPEYPLSLLELRDPPRLLFWQGQVLGPKDEATAMIGSRRADPWALQQAWQESLLLQKVSVGGQKFVASSAPHWVVSGLAEGCDLAAHKGTLRAGGKTLAVLPGGFDHIYPKHHERFSQRIVAEGGALVSEYVPQAAPLRWRFIARDRLQAALARRLLLVQSDSGGGSMHAVQIALEMGRPVYVLKGDEPCWDIRPTGPKVKDFYKSVCLRPHSRSFFQDESMMSANHALLDKHFAQTWSHYTSLGEGDLFGAHY